jgi:hypothetical protein
MAELAFIIEYHGYAEAAASDQITAAAKKFLAELAAAGAKFYGPPADPEKPTAEEQFSMAKIRHGYRASRVVMEKRTSMSGPHPGMELEHPTLVDAQVTEDLLAGETHGDYQHMKAL